MYQQVHIQSQNIQIKQNKYNTNNNNKNNKTTLTTTINQINPFYQEINTQNVKYNNQIQSELILKHPEQIQSTNSTNKHNHLNIINWNISSVKPEIFQVIRQVQPYIICLQEIRNYEFKNTPAYNFIARPRGTNKVKQAGGGVCIGIDSKINYRKVDQIIPNYVNEMNCDIQAIQIFHQLFQLIVINMYLPSENTFGQKKRKILQKWITDLISTNNQEKFLICGDLNSQNDTFPFLINLNKDNVHTFFRRTYKPSTLDYVYTSFRCNYTFKTNFQPSLSDHCYINITINIDKQFASQNTKQKIIKLPSKEGCKALCFNSEIRSEHIQSFLINMTTLQTQFKPYIIRRSTLRQKEPQKASLDSITKVIDNLLRSSCSNKSYSWIKRLSNLNPNKRDGAIVTCQLSQNGFIIVDQEEVFQNCINELVSLSQILPIIPQIENFPKLQPISIEEVIELQKQMSQNKAVTHDGFIDIWFKNTNKKSLLTNWWCPETLKLLPQSPFEARLIPLNKAYPNIPQLNEFRPITVLSSAIKWIELRFKASLQDYINNHIDIDQIGFVSQAQTQINIIQLIEEIQNYNKKDSMAAIFIDLKSAYNTVNREKLFQIVRKRQILDDRQSLFLENLYNNLYYQSSNGNKYHLKNGVPQGSILAPLLFDIYMDEVIQEIKLNFQYSLFKRLYADDLVGIIKLKHIETFIQVSKQIFIKYDLIFNQNKSQIFIIRPKPNQQKIQQIEGLNIVQEYNYLGIRINSNGSLSPHLSYLKSRVSYLEINLRFYTKMMSFKNQYLIWIIYIRSLFLQCTQNINQNYPKTIQRPILKKFQKIYWFASKFTKPYTTNNVRGL